MTTENNIKEFVIDLFCGAGGTSSGVHLANCNSTVIACVNHDSKAIESHRLNHPKAKHFVEDVRNPEVIFWLKLRVNALRKLYPDCIITVWASLECINFSKAKGGLPRDADSRTLANSMLELPVHLDINGKKISPNKLKLYPELLHKTITTEGYIPALNPDYLKIENVVEFMSWGPLDKNGKPVSRKRGSDYLNWVENLKSHGYKYDWKELNSADFGAFTSRNRYFAQFAGPGLPIAWPVKTHAKNPSKEKDLFDTPLKKWNAVKEVLNLENEGKSIFDRKKPLVENTLKRIYAGLVKFVADGDESFILKYNSTNKNSKHVPPSIQEPCPTVAAQNRLGIVNANFLQSYYGNGQAHSTEKPCPTVSTKDRFAKIAPQFLVDYQYKSSGHSLENPSPTLLTKDKFAKASVQFIEQQYGNSKPKSIDEPLNTITNNPKFGYVTAEKWLMDTSFQNKGRGLDEPAPTVLASRKHHYLMNPQFKNAGSSVEKPCPTVIARQDKKPLGLIACEHGMGFMIPVYEEDTPTMVKIKQFMAYFGIVDIKMRMLEVEELLRIQGFPEGYQLVGNQTDKKKFIGNSVEVTTAKAIFEAHHQALEEYFEKQKIAA